MTLATMRDAIERIPVPKDIVQDILRATNDPTAALFYWAHQWDVDQREI